MSLLNAPGSQFGWVAKFEAEGDFARANEQYAQVGILLKPTIVEDVAWPNGKDGTLDLTNGLDVASNTGLTAQEKALFTLRTKDKTDDIEVYYVNKFIGSDASGLSVCASSNPPPEYVDSVMIKGIGRLDKPFTLAHEIGHVLTNVLDNNGHFVGKPRLINLMNAGTSGSDHIQATKRLVTDQENLILRQRPMLLSAPG